MDTARHVMADAHVHFYDGFHRTPFLDSAVSNFRRGAQELDLPVDTPGVLLLTERSQEDYYRRWRAEDQTDGGPWSFRRTAEECSLIAYRDDGEKLFVLAGSQIATGDGLEVLALASTEEFEDGRPFPETLDSVLASGAITVVPWGFGKWSFARGDRVAGLVSSASGGTFFLGDNANRLRWGPDPKLFGIARERGIHVLPGSDPLPFPRDGHRAGSYGFAVPADLDPERPAESLRKALLRTEEQPVVYGSLEQLPRFFVNQLALQWRKRRRRSKARP